MATYAAYRHIELDNVGYGKKRVLKPPGGGSSDIFGAGHPGHNEHSGGRKQVLAKNANQSQLSHGFFSESETDLAPAPQAQQAPATPVSQNGSTSSIGSGSAPDTPRSSKPDGNPVTGAGYDMQHNGGGSTGSSIAGSDKSSTDSSPSVAPVQRMKNRVPPGGFSSGLW